MILASGGGDGKVRLWRVPPDPTDSISDPTILNHSPDDSIQKDVTTVEWHPLGLLLASGSLSGHCKVWSKSGDLKFNLVRHTGSIFSVKWSKKGDLLVSVSSDCTAVVWDTASGETRQQFEFHENAILDVDWKDDYTFTTCSSDKLIYTCRMGMLEPLKIFSGHTHEVNCIRWDSMGILLASCSDDLTTKIWTLESNAPLFSFTGHTKEVYSLRWCPFVVSANSKPHRLLATSSFDGTIRIWDTMSGTLRNLLDSQHSAQVYSISFSPDGMFLASGGFDGVVNIWKVADGSHLKRIKGTSSIYDVSWSVKGDKVCVSYNDGLVSVLHLSLR